MFSFFCGVCDWTSFISFAVLAGVCFFSFFFVELVVGLVFLPIQRSWRLIFWVYLFCPLLTWPGPWPPSLDPSLLLGDVLFKGPWLLVIWLSTAYC